MGGGPPPPGGSTRAPIGVPEDYTAVIENPVLQDRTSSPTAVEAAARDRFIERAPRYFEGDEFKPAQLGPASIAELQRQMVEAGLLTDSFRLGVWDSATVAAYRDLLSYANASGLTDRQALLRYRAGEQVGEPERAPLVIQQSNPEELRRVFRQAVIETLGVGWDRGRIDQAVQAYMAEEARVQREAYDLELTGGTITNIPSPETFIEERARREEPVEAQVHDTLDFVQQFMSLANSSAWSGGG